MIQIQIVVHFDVEILDYVRRARTAEESRGLTGRFDPHNRTNDMGVVYRFKNAMELIHNTPCPIVDELPKEFGQVANREMLIPGYSFITFTNTQQVVILKSQEAQ